ncbi:MAG: 16S rRNA (guanine(527)-N(7))-methyltransferase RsmG [Bacillota bacterium]
MKYETQKKIDNLFQELGIKAKEEARVMVSEYIKLLMKGMEKSRLTGERTERGIIEKQLYDAIYPLKSINIEKNCSVVDLGTGGGLPGIPVKIIRPDLEIYLLDSNRKKTVFLEEAIIKLKLTGIKIINDRAEVIGHDIMHREKHDYILCRAVAKLSVLAELSLPLLRIGGKAILYKGPRGDEEYMEAKNALMTCGGSLESIEKYTLKAGEARRLYVIKKIKNTPDQYPRKPGMPGKKPITEQI